MPEKKQNVFDDFIAASEWLIASGRPIGKVVADESLELAFLVQQLGPAPSR
jgi:hypothetical protein